MTQRIIPEIDVTTPPFVSVRVCVCVCLHFGLMNNYYALYFFIHAIRTMPPNPNNAQEHVSNALQSKWIFFDSVRAGPLEANNNYQDYCAMRNAMGRNKHPAANRCSHYNNRAHVREHILGAFVWALVA